MKVYRAEVETGGTTRHILGVHVQDDKEARRALSAIERMSPTGEEPRVVVGHWVAGVVVAQGNDDLRIGIQMETSGLPVEAVEDVTMTPHDLCAYLGQNGTKELVGAA